MTELPRIIANYGEGMVPDSSRQGKLWEELPTEALVGLCGHGIDGVRATAAAELQRRTAERSISSSGELIEAEQRLLNTIERFNVEASRQATRVMWLTVAMFVLAAAQTAATIAQVVLALRGRP